MAAHAKTGINQIIDSVERNALDIGIIQGCVNLSCFTEDNDELWQALYEFVNNSDMPGALDDLYHKLVVLRVEIEQEWSMLGMPTTREEWLEAKYETQIR